MKIKTFSGFVAVLLIDWPPVASDAKGGLRMAQAILAFGCCLDPPLSDCFDE